MSAAVTGTGSSLTSSTELAGAGLLTLVGKG